MVLRRQTGVNPSTFLDVAVLGFTTAYRPEQITGGVKQGDESLALLQDEIDAAGWPGPPRAGDAVLMDAKTWQVVGNFVLRDGPLAIGHKVWIRGGG